ncbi:MAG: helix-turn-helix transcriptional regulator [Chloroflexi bacterium]|nr:helix-turn-helix transcriptional regulator [Chloroflexota bacterium]
MALKQQPSNQSPAKHERVLGQRVERLRLSRNITQADLAKQAGIGIRTLRRLEAGEGGTLDTFFRILSALKLDGNVELVIPDPAIRPIERVRMKGTERKRASSSQKQAKSKQPWRWGPKQYGG